jgi:hypothetical protein
MSTIVILGVIGAPHGVKGEVRVKSPPPIRSPSAPTAPLRCRTDGG